MRKKLICTLLALGVVSSSTFAVSPVKAAAAEQTTAVSVNATKVDSVTIGAGQVTPMTIYDWWVYNLGVSAWGISQIKGPMSGGNFNTEGIFSSDKTFTISWSGAPSNAYFKIKAIGQDAGNSGMVTSSEYCSGSSGSVTFTIPYEMRGRINLYVDSYTSTDINIGSIHVTN